jgi:adenine-specific DNA-methyltransferase
MPKQPVFKTTPFLTDDQFAALRTLIPQAFTEGKIDPDKMRATLGDLADDRPERYSFSWFGKRDAIRLLQAPSRATLIPARDESLDFDTTQNLFIEGDNLEVLKLLHKPYFGRVKMIYIDPPYNTGNDFVYPDNFADPLDTYLKLTGQKDSEGNLLTSNPETGGRYHSAWLSMMYPRLFLARQLLREDGVIFVSIDDHEVHNLRLLMNEVFGEENFVDCIVWQKKVSPSNDAKWFSSDHDYLVVYAKSKEIWRPQRLKRTEKQKGYYKNPDNDPRGDWNSATYTCNKSKKQRPNLYYPIVNPNTGQEIWPRETAVWAYSREENKKHAEENRIYWGVDGKAKMPRMKTFLFDAKDVVPRSIWPYSEVGHTQEATQEFMSFFPEGGFDSPKPSRLIKRVLQLSSNSNDLVLDFFAGSCTTAQAVLELNREDGGNRRFIMVQLPEPIVRAIHESPQQFPTIAEIGKERIRRVVTRMKDLTPGPSPKGRGEQARQLGMPLETRATPEDLGFKVFKLAQSNYRQWEGAQPDAAAFTRQAELFADPLVEGWQLENVLYEVALKEGYGLNVQVEETAVKGVQRVTDPDKDQSFYLTLAGKLALKNLRPLDLKKDDLFICRDSALDDEAAANLALQCRLKTI